MLNTNSKGKILKNIFGTSNSRKIKKLNKVVEAIGKLSGEYDSLTDEELTSKITELRQKVAKEGTASTINEIFALCRVASTRVLGMTPYDVQIMGGIVLNEGSIAEMATGEGKTLVATMPAVLNAFSGKQVHAVTVNDYLAKRDALLMKPLYERMGLSVSFIQSNMSDADRKVAYESDIIYGTNSEFAFDYLRDNMALSPSQRVQKGLFFAIIDEVDSILIDEARTPLIVSGRGEVKAEVIHLMNDLVSEFTVHVLDEKNDQKDSEITDDAVLTESTKHVRLCETGFVKLEKLLVEKGVLQTGRELYESRNLYLIGAMQTALRANHAMHKNVDYMVTEGKVHIINAATGRVEPGRRWSEGLHQAIEAKEEVEILPDNQTLGSISLQNYFRMYEKISGMTGTADTEAKELYDVYGLPVVVIPTHKPNIRIDERDRVYMKKANKYRAIINEIKKQHQSGRPILVGTESVKESDMISQQLDRLGLQHLVLNAKNHESEAYIIAQAGRPGAITISTNMAGRGTDIILGGNLKSWIDSLENPGDEDAVNALKKHWKENHKTVVDAGGLCVIGTTRHQNRRVDNQLRGRAGRQGDPGQTIFFVSLQDDLMAQFGGQRYIDLFSGLNLDDDAYIEHRIVDKALSDAQGKLEGQLSGMRKEMLKYDDIVDLQRKEVYETRLEWLHYEDAVTPSKAILEKVIRKLAEQYLPVGAFFENWDIDGFRDTIQFSWGLSLEKWTAPDGHGSFNDTAIHDEVVKVAIDEAERLIGNLPQEHVNGVARVLMLNCMDEHWREQIGLLESLRSGIHLRSYAQKQPVQEFGREAMELFETMIEAVEVSYAASFIQGLHGLQREIQKREATEEPFDNQ